MMQSARKANIAEVNTRQVLEEMLLNDTIRVQLQPVVSLKNGEVKGYQTVINGPAGSTLESTDALTNCARQHKLTEELEYAALVKVLSIQHTIPERCFLSIPVGSRLFLSSLFREITNLCQHIAPQLVFELTEHPPLVEQAFLRKQIKALIAMGYRITLNVSNRSLSDIERATKLQPSIIKLCLDTVNTIIADEKEYTHYQRALNNVQTDVIMMQANNIDANSDLPNLEALGITLVTGNLGAGTQLRAL